jgi:UbiD family decarboxylase
MPFQSFEDFIRAADRIGEVKYVNGASRDQDVGCLTELFYEQDGPMLVFDKFEGFPDGFRVCSNPVRSTRRTALAMGMAPDSSALEIAYLQRDRRRAPAIPPVVVSDGPVLECVQEGNQVDLETFPTPLWHKGDGGRYIGTGDIVINRDPETGYVNLGVYRAMIQGRDRVNLWMNPQKHGIIISQRYWQQGKASPVAVVLGCEPVTWMAAPNSSPFGISEYELAGAMRGSPVEVVELPLTGLPVPAYAEIVLEGEIPPLSQEQAHEGPFGEWPGYYSHEGPECVVRIKRIYHRKRPIIWGEPPMRPKPDPIPNLQVWDHLERSGISDITGVWAICTNLLIVISLRQRYAGHAKQALITAAGFRHGDMKTYYMAVDDDIDPGNLNEVLWALCTRVDPATGIDVIRDVWTADLDPRIPPARRKANDLTVGRCLIDATKPFSWKSEFPKSNVWGAEDRREVTKKWTELMQTLSRKG